MPHSCSSNALPQSPSTPDCTMEDGRTNLVPRLQQDAFMHALAAAQPGDNGRITIGGRGDLSNAVIPGNGRNAVFEDHSLGRSVPTSFEDEQIGDIVDPLFVENTHVSHVDDDNYSAYGLLATPGNGAYESSATPGNGAYESLAMTGNGTYTNPWATAHSDNHHFAPFVNTNHPRLAQSTSAAAVTYNDGMALLTAPNPYIWGPVTAERPMGEYIGADFQYPDPSLPMMSSFTANTNGTGYHGQFPANSLETQWGTAVELPNAFHAVDTDATPFNVGQPVLPRPKCTECNQTFGRQADLDRHAKIHQADSKVFQCQVEGCKYSSYRKDKLNEHVKRRHQASSAASTQL